MSVYTECLMEACRRLAVPYSLVDGDRNFLQINLKRRYYFPGSSTPFNEGSTSKICRDKEFSYKLLKEAVRMPRSMGFVDPDAPETYQDYVRVSSPAAVVEKIRAEFKLPVIVKRNSGSQGQNVFLCKNPQEVADAVQKVFEKEAEPPTYDHVLLAQEYIEAKKEYRAVVFEQKILLLYEKDTAGAVFTGNLSPLHWENSHAVRVTDLETINRLETFIAPIYPLLDLRYGGLDIIEAPAGDLVLLELNSRPGFGRFVKDNGREPLIEMYEKILRSLS